MGDLPTKSISLKDRLLHSSKTISNIPNVSLPNSEPAVVSVDNATNEPLPTSQYSDKKFLLKTLTTAQLNP